MSGTLAGRRILITGAARGIGLATVTRFLAEGAGVAALDRDAQALSGLRSRFEGAAVNAVQADVAEPASVAAAIADCVAKLGGLDGVVNAAGIDLVADIEAMELTQWSHVLAVNLTGPMLVMRAAFPHLRASGGGTIVNVSSGAGLSPLKHRTAYCASMPERNSSVSTAPGQIVLTRMPNSAASMASALEAICSPAFEAQ